MRRCAFTAVVLLIVAGHAACGLSVRFLPFTFGTAYHPDVLLAVPEGAPPTALVVLLHGYGMTGDGMFRYTFNYEASKALLETHKIMVAAPTGRTDNFDNNQTHWRATRACCGEYRVADWAAALEEDPAYVRALVDELLAEEPSLLPSRVFLWGYSNGAFLAHRVACAHADVVAAVAAFAGGQSASTDPLPCKPAAAVHVLTYWGTDDGTVNYTGGAWSAQTYPGAEETVARWAAAKNCTAAAATVIPHWPYAQAQLVFGAMSAPETDKLRVSGCGSGCGATELWRLNDVGHFPRFTSAHAAHVLGWLANHTRDVCVDATADLAPPPASVSSIADSRPPSPPVPSSATSRQAAALSPLAHLPLLAWVVRQWWGATL